MKVLEPIRVTIESLDRKQFYLAVAGYVALVLLLAGVIIYYASTAMEDVRRQMQATNRKREDVQFILNRLAQVKQQRTSVNEMLAADKNFRLKNYLEGMLKQVNLQSQLVGSLDPDEQQLIPGYAEVRVPMKLSGLTIKTLYDLLSTLDAKERVYTKNLEIVKNPSHTLDVSLVVATLKPQSDTSESTE